MKPSNVQTSLKILIKCRQPVFLWGPPGVGKSQVVQQITRELEVDCTDVRAVLLDPVDLRGLPHINGDHRAHWATPDFLPQDGKGVLFLDELNAAPPLVQAACYQLVLDRRIGEYILPEGWAVIAAGNRESDRAVTHRMPSALANRFVHINFEADVEDWTAWALRHGIKNEVIAFLRFRPELLHQFEGRADEKAFPSPRSWEFVSNVLGQNPSSDVEYDLLAGTVGEGAAIEMLGFLRIFRSLPSPDAVLINPSGAIVPEDPAALYALCGALAKKASDNNFGRLIAYALRLPAEFSVLLVRDAIHYAPEVQNTRAFIEWSANHQDVLI